ncbi:radical SAM/SPASM domain-containing protein [Sporanaerobacter acetigenes]|uniref:Radical SAM core domain-containing protein n=1 Tax=Sporanaerobacter acetigenes DSM 13106 TaxID=1123281 RepID=A0A1M5ZAN9_9FIRM|nr:radical SAM protein [Sporanaerobacter acetigenes]SHI21301.1 uncharacterized protein SAMN02745180_02913 [Sporanaerobacter acetigenes DSM 13106]
MNNFHYFKLDDDYILFDGDTLNIFPLKEELGRKLDNITNLELDEILSKLTQNNLENKGKELLDTNINMDKCKRLVLILARSCNLNCKYCYAEGGNYGSIKDEFMKEDIIEPSINYVLNKFPEGIESIQFFGGEPLLNKKLLKKSCENISKYFENKNIEKPSFTLVTNATLIDDECIEIFNKYFTSITISLDGNKELNDTNRIFKNSNQSVYDTVIKNIHILNEKRKFNLFIEMTVDTNHIDYFVKNNQTIPGLDEINSMGVDMIHVVPTIDSGGTHCSISKSNVEDIRNFFDKYLKQAFKSDNEGFNIEKISSTVNAIKNKKVTGYHCVAGITDLTIDVNGDVYPCFMFLKNKDFIMDNVLKTDTDKYQNIQLLFIENRIYKNNNCNKCWAKNLCTDTCAGCVGGYYLANKDISKPIDVNCIIGKTMIERIIAEIVNLSK